MNQLPAHDVVALCQAELTLESGQTGIHYGKSGRDAFVWEPTDGQPAYEVAMTFGPAVFCSDLPTAMTLVAQFFYGVSQ